MAAPRRRKPNSVAETLTFWSIVVLISAIAAFISFRIGRDWLGKRLGDMQISQGAPRIVAEAQMDAENAARIEQEKRAPAKVEPVLEDRQPTPVELRRIEREEAMKQPQDGAQLNGWGADDDGEPPAKETPDEPEPADVETSTDSGSGPLFTVTAGAFEDRAHAQGVVSRLNAKGYSPYIEKVTKDGKTFHRVCVARVRGRVNAQELQKEIAAQGLTAGLIVGG